MRNWPPTTHHIVVSKGFITLLFQVGMKRKFNLGNPIFEHILGHVENTTYQKALRYPSLLFGILTAQKLNLVTPIDILGPSIAGMWINHKLYKGYHFRNVFSGKNIGKEKVLETIIEFELVITSKGQSSSIVLTKSKILDLTIRSQENILGHLYK